MFSTTNTVQLFILLFTIRHFVCLEEFIEYTNNQTKFIGEDARFNCTFSVTQNGDIIILGASYWEYKLSNDDTFRLIVTVTQEHNFTLLEEGVSLGHSALVVKKVSFYISLRIHNNNRCYFMYHMGPFISYVTQIRENYTPPPYVSFFTYFVTTRMVCHTLVDPTPWKRYVTFERPLSKIT